MLDAAVCARLRSRAVAGRPPEYRPYRVALYAIFLAFTLTFIGLVIRSVWMDLFLRDPVTGLVGASPSPTACIAELETLYRKLDSRLNLPITPAAERDWDTFSREFEDRLNQIEARCVNQSYETQRTDVTVAIHDAAEKLDALRLHLSRCGEEGERERLVVVQALEALRGQVRASDLKD